MSDSRAARQLDLMARLRWARLGMYVLMACSGIYGIFYPPTVLVDASERTTAIVCAGFWAVGGTWCAVTVLRHSFGGEYLWLRSLSIAVGCFSLALATQIAERGAALGVYALLFLAMAVSLWGWSHLVRALVDPKQMEADDG